MVYTLKEYSKVFMFGNKYVSASTIKRRCVNDMLPLGHIARKLPLASKGVWIIEVINK